MPLTQAEKDNSPLLQERHIYKPFLYPWCHEAWLTQQRLHWLPEEVPLAEDVRDWKKNLTESEICLLYTSPSPRDRQKSRMPSSA